MVPPTRTPTSDKVEIAVLQTQLTNIAGSILELKDMMQDFNNRLQVLEKNEIGCRAVADGRIDAAHRRLDSLESKFKELEKFLPVLKVMGWLAGVLGVLVVTLLWAIFTGQIQVIPN